MHQRVDQGLRRIQAVHHTQSNERRAVSLVSDRILRLTHLAVHRNDCWQVLTIAPVIEIDK